MAETLLGSDVRRHAFAAWAGAHLGSGPVRLLGKPGAAGASSDTLLFDVGDQEFVLRLPPSADDLPLFPTYDLARQFAVMERVAERTTVPVPVVRRFEDDPSVLGAPFLVMERIEGVPAPDMPPYVFGSWLTEASSEQLAQVEDAVVEVLAGVHAVADVRGLELDAPGSTPLRRHVEQQRRYAGWVSEEAGRTFPVLDDAFAWLDERWPADEGPVRLSWGDARLANLLFHDFRVVAVLDWEAAAAGPPELDLGWCLFFHAHFQRVAERFGHVGLPWFLEPARVVAAYEARTGHVVRDLEWYLVYAELRQAITSVRVSMRGVQRGDLPAPDDPQDLVMGRAHLEALVRS